MRIVAIVMRWDDRLGWRSGLFPVTVTVTVAVGGGAALAGLRRKFVVSWAVRVSLTVRMVSAAPQDQMQLNGERSEQGDDGAHSSDKSLLNL